MSGSGADLICGWKISGHFLRDLPRRRPFGSALQGGDKVDTCHSGNIVAHGRVKDATLPEVRAINIGSSNPVPLFAGSENAVARTSMFSPGPFSVL